MVMLMTLNNKENKIYISKIKSLEKSENRNSSYELTNSRFMKFFFLQYPKM